MSFTACTFLVAADTTMVAQVLSAFENRDIQPPEYLIVSPARKGSEFAVLAFSDLKNAPSESLLLEHPDLQTNIGQVDENASVEVKDQITSDHGLAIVMTDGFPVELLAPGMYGDGFRLTGGLSRGPSLTCPKCGQTSRKVAGLKNGRIIDRCSRCGQEWQQPETS